MSSRVRQRSLGWRSQDPVGGGPKREIQSTEHACSKSAVYPLWTRVFDPPALPPMLTAHLNRWVVCIWGEALPRPRDGILDTASWWLRSYPQLQVLGPIVGRHPVTMMDVLTWAQLSPEHCKSGGRAHRQQPRLVGGALGGACLPGAAARAADQFLGHGGVPGDSWPWRPKSRARVSRRRGHRSSGRSWRGYVSGQAGRLAAGVLAL